MDLIICSTPLHVIQILSLIDKKIIKSFDVIYLAKENTEQSFFYYKKISVNSQRSNYFVNDKKFPFHAHDIKKIFDGERYNGVFFATVDSIYVHYILSIIKYNKIVTVDDGTANIKYNSHYYMDKRTIIYKIVYALFNIKYDLRRVKHNINTHYSIYNGVENLIDNVCFNDLVFNTSSVENKKSNINILLGTVYGDITDDKDLLISKIREHLLENNDVFYYIPHPRDTKKYFNNVVLIDGVDIAEVKIIKALSENEKVNVYGFSSSAQVNLKYRKGIFNYNLISSILTDKVYVDADFISYSLDNITNT